MKTNIYDIIKSEFRKIIRETGLEAEEVLVHAKPLTTEKTIGNPEDRDYPLVTGKERMMQAEFKKSRGQAFTDIYGNFSGPLVDIAEMELTNNFRRAIFISSLNTVMQNIGWITQSTHCKDDEPKKCSYELDKYIEENHGQPKIALIGLHPRMVEVLSPKFELKISDLTNISTEKFGAVIHGPEETPEHLEWRDLALVTGTTLVNNTVNQFMISEPVVFYGITIAGVARLLGLNH
ncbi:Rossmann-like domain-containing protein [Chloroflexota bacterium]